VIKKTLILILLLLAACPIANGAITEHVLTETYIGLEKQGIPIIVSTDTIFSAGDTIRMYFILGSTDMADTANVYWEHVTFTRGVQVDGTCFGATVTLDSTGCYGMMGYAYYGGVAKRHFTGQVAVFPSTTEKKAIYDSDAATLTEVVAAFSGEGAELCSLYVLDSSDSSAISGCKVRVKNNALTTTEAYWQTGSSGLFEVSLYDGSYWVEPFKPGYTFSTSPESIAVSSGLVDTIFGAAFDPGSPSSPSLCRAWGYIYDFTGDSLMGVTVSAKPHKSPLRDSTGVILDHHAVTDTTDVHGYWYIDVYATVNTVPNTKYQFKAYYPSGTVVKKDVTVPDSSSWRFTW